MDILRNGNFTSSEIYRLMGSDKVMATYIKEKQRERRLKTSINIQATSYPLSWGRVMQNYVFENHLGIEYKLGVDKPKMHKSSMWVGSEDVVSLDCVGEMKCPFTRTSFCDLVETIECQSIDILRIDYPDYYWQIVSNAEILNKKFGELIVWMPYANEFPDILEFISNIEDYELQKDIQWVIHAAMDRLPHLPDDSDYKNIYRYKFEIPEADKLLLRLNVEKAYNILNPKPIQNDTTKTI